MTLRVAWMLVAMILLMPVASLVSSGPAAAADVDYLGRSVQISTFDNTEISTYGLWTYAVTHGGNGSFAKTYDSNAVQGSKSLQLKHYNYGPNDYAMTSYVFTAFPTTPMARLDSLSFSYSGDIYTTVNQNIQALVGLYVDDSLGNQLVGYYQYFTLDGNWHDIIFNDLNLPGAASLELAIHIFPKYSAMMNASAILLIDDLKATSKMSQVRFSFFNEYTGLGQTSELLIPELWHDGKWYRVWNNEIGVAQGETVAYRVTDYFGQTVKMSLPFVLLNSTEYIDVSVKLVKVHIAKPDWWSSNLPPEWYMTYLQTGTQLTVSGWDLEVLAGWYKFSWDQQIATNLGNGIEASDNDLVVSNGSVDQVLEGNMTGRSDFQLSNFFLQMTPTTVSDIQYGTTSIIPPGLDSYQGWISFLGSLANEIYTNNYYVIIMVAIGMITIIAFVWSSGKAVVQTVAANDKPRKNRNPTLYSHPDPKAVKGRKARRRKA